MTRRVSFFLPTLGAGGAENVIITIANALGDKGWDVEMVAAKATGALRHRVAPSIPVVDLACPRTRSALPKLAKYLRAHRPDLVLSTLSHANIVAVAAKMLSGTRPAVLIRQADAVSSPAKPSPGERVFRRLQGIAYHLSDGIVSVSHGMAEDLTNTFGLSDKVHTIYNPVDLDYLRASSAAPPGHPWFAEQQAPVLLAVGRLAPEKDFPTLIRAFHRLRRRVSGRLIIVGEGPERARLERLVQELGLEAAVDLPGYTPNPYAYMAHAQVFVLSSRSEGLPNALIEAMALGCRIVSTNCGSGPREILHNGRYGRLVPAGDPESLGQALQAAMADPPHRTVDEGRISRFSLPVVTEAYSRLFESVITHRTNGLGERG